MNAEDFPKATIDLINKQSRGCQIINKNTYKLQFHILTKGQKCVRVEITKVFRDANSQNFALLISFSGSSWKINLLKQERGTPESRKEGIQHRKEVNSWDNGVGEFQHNGEAKLQADSCAADPERKQSPSE